MSNELREKMIKSIIKVFFVVVISIGSFIWLYNYNKETYITGTIVGKYTTGYGDKIHYFTISDDERYLKIKVTPGHYNKYNIMDEVYVDYSLMKEAVSIAKAKK